MSQDETLEVLGTAYRPMSRRRRVVSLVIAAAVAVAAAYVAVPRMLDDTSKVATRAQPGATRKQLLRALGRETTTRTDALQVMDGLEFAFMENHAYPADVAALNSALDRYHRALAPGDSIAWYVRNDTGYVYCVEHHTGGNPDAYALYASTVGGIVETDHGAGCIKSPADYAAAEATVASLTGNRVPS